MAEAERAVEAGREIDTVDPATVGETALTVGLTVSSFGVSGLRDLNSERSPRSAAANRSASPNRAAGSSASAHSNVSRSVAGRSVSSNSRTLQPVSN